MAKSLGEYELCFITVIIYGYEFG